jgi:5-methylcytosine-specific restriction endonuclease McrBC regulatory subunit McrC
VCYYYMPMPTTYHWNISFQNKCSSKYVVKNARNVTQCVWQPFSIEFQGFVKKGIKYIHQNLRYYETIEQIHFMVVKIESYVFWKKNCNIWSSLIPPPPSSKTTKE